MAKKSLAGQMNMFDFFRNLENIDEVNGDVEMVSLMPDFEQSSEQNIELNTEELEETSKPELVSASKIKDDTKSVTKSVTNSNDLSQSDISMHRQKLDKDGKVIAEIMYINYNKVLIRRVGEEDILKVFDTSYEAVDYYVDNMIL